VEPAVDGLDAALWLAGNRQLVERELPSRGGILWRGFAVRTRQDFERFIAALPLATMTYVEGATPRTQLSDKVYTSTEFPSTETIALHNELTYVRSWPTRIVFCCLTAAEQGGETPIADVRQVLRRLRPETAARFRDRGWMLVRNFGDGLSLTWQKAFHTGSRAEVERYCEQARISWEWKQGDRLRTWQVRPAIVQHPATGDEAWFNHVAFWHVSSLRAEVRDMLLGELGEAGLPYNTLYGDGTPIEPEVVEEIRAAYREETIVFLWQPGDVLVLDNLVAAHGRRPFTGARQVVVAMGDPITPGA
jgi:alpha-ketoglutarate-dependent taurine dioxygenase